MNARGQIVLGGVLVAAGLLALADLWLDISLWPLLLPLFLIGLGIWVLGRPGSVAPGTKVTQRLFGDVVRREGVADEDIFVLLGDVKIDWPASLWPETPVTVWVSNLLGDIRIRVPEGVGVSVASRAALGTLRLDGREREASFALVHAQTDDFETAGHRLDVHVVHLLGDVTIERAAGSS